MLRNGRTQSIMLAVLIATFSVGCAKKPAVVVKVAPPPALPGGWAPYDAPSDGFSIGIPPGWKVSAQGSMTAESAMSDFLSTAAGESSPGPSIDMGGMPGMPPSTGQGGPNEEQMKEALKNLEASLSQNEAEREKAAAAMLRKKGVILQAVDGSRPTPGEERTRFYVRTNDHPGNLTLDEAAAEEKDHLKAFEPKQNRMDLPIGPAARFESQHETRGGDKVTQISFVIPDQKKTWILRFISTNNPVAITSVADDVARSWRIRPGKG